MAKAVDRNDLKDIIDTLIAEAIGEGPEGMRLVAETILNRADEKGKSPGQIVRAKKQYTGYSSPGAGAKKAQQTKSARDAAEAAWQLAQGPEDPTQGADHYFNPNIVTPSWAASMTPTLTAGGHAFFRDGPPIRRAVASATPTSSPNLSALRQNYATSNAPTPFGIDEQLLARTGVGGSRVARANSVPSVEVGPRSVLPDLNAGRYTGPSFDVSYPRNDSPDYANTGAIPYQSPITASDRVRGTRAANSSPSPASFDEMLLARTGVGGARVPAPQLAPIPASADERLLARTGVGGNRIPPTPIAPTIVPSSNIERSAPRQAQMPNIGTSQIERNAPNQPQYATGNPFVDASMAARQVAENRLAPSEGLPPALYGYSAQVAPSAPLPMPTVQRRLPTNITPPQAVASLAPIAPVPVTRAPMGGGANQLIPQDVSLGPVNNLFGRPNAVPKNINIAANAPAPLGRIQRQSSILPGIRLPGILGMAQDLSQGINNASGTFGNNLDNFIQQNMRRGSNVGVPVATSGGFNYARTPQGRYVNVGPVNSSISPAQRAAGASNYRTTNTAADRVNDPRSLSSSGASAYSISG